MQSVTYSVRGHTYIYRTDKELDAVLMLLSVGIDPRIDSHFDDVMRSIDESADDVSRKRRVSSRRLRRRV